MFCWKGSWKIYFINFATVYVKLKELNFIIGSVENNNYIRIIYRNDNVARLVKTVIMRKNAHSRSYVLKISSIIPSVFVTHIPAFANSCCNI